MKRICENLISFFIAKPIYLNLLRHGENNQITVIESALLNANQQMTIISQDK